MALPIKDKLIAGFLTAGLMAAPVSATLTGNGVSLEPNSAVAGEQQAALEQVNVPLRDARENSVKAVRHFSVGASDGGLILTIFGRNQDLFETTLQAAREGIAEDRLPVRGIVIGPTDQPSSLEIFGNGQRFATFNHPEPATPLGPKDVKAIRDALNTAHAQLVVPALTSALENSQVTRN